MTITIGADPEVFLQDKDGSIVSAIGYVGGSKDEPVAVTRGAVQEDNVLAEFNIDPANSRDEFITNIKTVMGQLRERVGGFQLAVITSHEFTMQQLLQSGRAALMFGCDPDYNAYTGEMNPAPMGAQTGLRTAGGHIHVGYDDPSIERNSEIGRLMDLFLGVPSVLLDTDQRRRTLYGKAGAIRPKKYGVEYRTLSNFWLTHTNLIGWAYDRSVAAAESDYIITEGDEVVIQNCINNGDGNIAKHLINKYDIVMP